MFYSIVKKPEKFDKIIKHLEKWAFLRAHRNGKIDPFSFGLMGRKVFENIRTEWTRSNVVNRDQQVFTTETNNSHYPALSYKDSFVSARKFILDLPLGFIDVKKSFSKNGTVTLESGWSIVKPSCETVFRYVGFFKPDAAREFFYRWQLERKRWWRLFSRDPGNFSLNAETNGDKETATVVCRYPWGEFYLESVHFHSSSWFDQLPPHDQTEFSIVVERKRIVPHVVECRMSGDLATLLYMCDAFSDENKKPLLVFHRKIAPYRFAFSIPFDYEEHQNDLIDLCKMLSLELRRRGVETLWPQPVKKSLESQFDQYDYLGIPYTIVVSFESLTNGIIGIRDRDTTLQEQVHITDVGDYGELLVKNYEIKNF